MSSELFDFKITHILPWVDFLVLRETRNANSADKVYAQTQFSRSLEAAFVHQKSKLFSFLNSNGPKNKLFLHWRFDGPKIPVKSAIGTHIDFQSPVPPKPSVRFVFEDLNPVFLLAWQNSLKKHCLQFTCLNFFQS